MASVGVGLALLLVFRTQDLSILGDTLGAEALSGGSTAAAMLAALAVGGWVFIGFDACVGVVGGDARRRAPRARARSGSRCSASAALVILNAVATTLAHPDPAAVVAGERRRPGADRGRRARSAPGRTSRSPRVVLAAFLACGIAAQSLTARAMYSISRDGVLPGSRSLRRVDRRGVAGRARSP